MQFTEQTCLNLYPHHYDRKDHPQYKQAEPVDGAGNDVGS